MRLDKLKAKWLPQLAKSKVTKRKLKEYQSDIDWYKKSNPNWREAIN